MKDVVTEVSSYMPTTAVIRATAQGNLIVSSISIRNRLIKSCVSCSIKRIIVIASSEDEKTSYIENANEKSSTIEHVGDISQININDSEVVLYIEDGFLLHTSLLEEFITSGGIVMKSPSNGQNIFSKNSFGKPDQMARTTDEIFEADPFKIFVIQHNNLNEARSQLFKWLSKKSDGFISKTLNRPISTFFSRFFAEYPIPPIYFTAVTALLAALMTYVLIIGGESGILWGCVLFHVASVADGIDGEIARAKYQISLNGAKLDTTIDMITNILFMGAMSFALWNTYGNEYLILGIYIVILAISGVLLMTALLYFGPGGGRFDVLANTIRNRFVDKPRSLKVFNFCNYFLKRDAFAFLFAVYGVLGLGKYIPEFLIFGLVIWNLAIILNARLILKSKRVTSGI